MRREIWTLILAAGAGRRLAEVTGGVPKQFWCPADGPSLLRQTIDRFTPVSPRARTVIVVDESHRPHFTAGDVADWAPDFVPQPLDRGTATGLLRALIPVMTATPDAIVVITPADHGVADETAFRCGVLNAVREAHDRDAVVLFGSEPVAPHTDYGWFSLAGTPSAREPRRVMSFVEKPTLDVAVRLYASGAVCNTMVIVARARTLWNLYCERLPDLAAVFARTICLRDAEQHAFLETAYPTLPSHDFSRDVLTGAPGLFGLVWPASVGWSDLGTPDRLRDWRQRTRRRSAAHVIPAA